MDVDFIILIFCNFPGKGYKILHSRLKQTEKQQKETKDQSYQRHSKVMNFRMEFVVVLGGQKSA